MLSRAAQPGKAFVESKHLQPRLISTNCLPESLNANGDTRTADERRCTQIKAKIRIAAKERKERIEEIDGRDPGSSCLRSLFFRGY
jgi:hypothetical protein